MVRAVGSGAARPRPRGRPPSIFIDDPLLERERGEWLAEMALRTYQPELREHGPGAAREPMRASEEFDEGLVYAYYAGLIRRKAVDTIRSRTLAFADWFLDQRGARGPQPDAGLGIRLYRAMETVAAIRRKRKLEKSRPGPVELRDTLAVLEGELIPVDTVKHRLQRLGPYLAAYTHVQRAAGRARKGRGLHAVAEGVH